MPVTTVRPGHLIKELLLRMGELTQYELYRAYKDEIVDAKGRSPVRMRQQGMSYESFRKTVYFARQIGFMEEVGRGDPVGSLLMIEPGGASVVPSTPVILALTPSGRMATSEWDNLRKAYDVNRGVLPSPTRPRPQVPTINLPENFSIRSVPRIVMHLAGLRDIADSTLWPEEPYEPLSREVERIREAGEAWLERAEDVLGDRESEQLQDRVDNLQTFVIALEDEDLEAAQDALESV